MKGRLIDGVETPYWTETLYDSSLKILEEKDLDSAHWDTRTKKSRSFGGVEKVFAIMAWLDDSQSSGGPLYDGNFEFWDHAAQNPTWFSLDFTALGNAPNPGWGVSDGGVGYGIHLLPSSLDRLRVWEGVGLV